MSRLRSTFSSLTNHNYRLYFAGQTISVTGTWMQKIGQAWLVLELSESGTLLGATLALQHLPTLLVGPWGGLLADRLDKRRILITTQAAAGVLAAVLGGLTAAGIVQLWMVMVLALGLGVVHALDKPARNTFVLEMVGPQHLTNAITLNSVIANAGRTVGPAVAGLLIASVGIAFSFFINGASYLAVVLGLLIMRTSELDRAIPAAKGPGQLRDGLLYVRRTPALLGPLVLMTIAGLFAYEWAVTLPLLARDTLGGDAQTFGLMFSAMGVGAVLGGLVIAGTVVASVGSLLGTAAMFSIIVLLTSIAPTLETMLAGLFLLGAASIAFKSVATTLVQLRSAPEMRGRVMALLAVAVGGTTPFGAPLAGWIGETLGPRIALGTGGVATALAASAAALYLRKSRREASGPPGAVEDVRGAETGTRAS